jgi:Glycosyl transferase family 2
MTAPPRGLARLRAALARRRHGPYPSLERLERQAERQAAQGQADRQRLDALGGRLDRLDAQLAELSQSRELRDDLRDSLRALAAREPENRARLTAAREAPDYDDAWDEERPLVSVTVATLGRPELTSRSLPSLLAQSYGEIEVIVAGDGAPPETEAAVAALGDRRLRYLDLGPRQRWTDDPVKLWLVGATRARNAALRAARGRWIVEFDDDDALRPQCLESLLEHARATRAEAVYGQVRQHAGEAPREFCAFPPRLGRFSWAAGMYHSGLRFFGRELLAADLGLPGDWWLAERMLRAGVRFAMRDEVLCDAHASERGAAAQKRGRIPWTDPGERW